MKACFLQFFAGFLCGAVGWAGVSGLAGLAAFEISKNGYLKIPYDYGFLACLIFGGLVGGVPFAILGRDWASRKWPYKPTEMESARADQA